MHQILKSNSTNIPIDKNFKVIQHIFYLIKSTSPTTTILRLFYFLLFNLSVDENTDNVKQNTSLTKKIIVHKYASVTIANT